MKIEKKIIMAKAEGKQFEFLDESHINPGFLETFDFDSPNQLITTETDEFSAVCPFSGLPDISYVKIFWNDHSDFLFNPNFLQHRWYRILHVCYK